jgi:hypothetical protein
MQPDDPTSFDAFLDEAGPTIDVDIMFAGPNDADGDWVIRPVQGQEEAIIRFGVPLALEAWLLAVDGDELQRAAVLRRQLLSTITIFRKQRSVQFRFRPRPRRSGSLYEYLVSPASQLRHELVAPASLTYGRRRRERYEGSVATGAPTGTLSATWPPAGVRELLRRLDIQRPTQATVLRIAAHNGGFVERNVVYEVGDYAPARTLRGFTRPVNRVTRDLQREGLVPQGVVPALQADYEHGMQATGFLVPPEVAEVIVAIE